MSASSKPATPAFGFLTIVQQSELGLVGGYLVLNAGGRPLEFHCTAPVKPNRAQEILYGATLKSYLYGEQIGPALVNRGKTPPLIVFTDQLDAAAIRQQIEVPTVIVAPDEAECRDLLVLKLGSFRAALENRFSSDQPDVLERWKSHGQSLDLTEPFARIREALEEAQKSARAA